MKWIVLVFLVLLLWLNFCVCVMEECKYKLWGMIVVLMIFKVKNNMDLFVVIFVFGIKFCNILLIFGFVNVIL